MAAMTDGALSTFSKSFVQALQFPTVRAVLEKKWKPRKTRRKHVKIKWKLHETVQKPVKQNRNQIKVHENTSNKWVIEKNTDYTLW